MIYSALGSFVLLLVMVFSGIGMFGMDRWWLGLAGGAVIAAAWHVNRRVGLLLGVVGAGLLLLGLTGFAGGLTQADRAMLNGMTVGFALGLAISAALRWRQVRPYLIELARAERVRWLSRLLGDR